MRGTKKLKNKLPPFVPLTWKALNSEAYKKLPGGAAKALPYFLGKIQDIPYKDPARYDTRFSFTYSEAQHLDFGKSTFYKILGKLIAHGFIDLEKKGGKRSFGLSNTIFRLSRRWERYGSTDFKDGDWKRYYPVSGLVLKVDSTSPDSELNHHRLKSVGYHGPYVPCPNKFEHGGPLKSTTIVDRQMASMLPHDMPGTSLMMGSLPLPFQLKPAFSAEAYVSSRGRMHTAKGHAYTSHI